MIEADLFEHLKVNVPAVEERIYPLIMPQDCKKPALVYTVINNGDKQSLSGCVVSIETRFQVDVYATSYLEGIDIKHEVKAALYLFEHYPVDLNSRDAYEQNEELFRQIIDFRLSISN